MGRVSALEQVFPSWRVLLIHFEDFSENRRMSPAGHATLARS